MQIGANKKEGGVDRGKRGSYVWGKRGEGESVTKLSEIFNIFWSESATRQFSFDNIILMFKQLIFCTVKPEANHTHIPILVVKLEHESN